jgi:hypothetical protein
MKSPEEVIAAVEIMHCGDGENTYDYMEPLGVDDARRIIQALKEVGYRLVAPEVCDHCGELEPTGFKCCDDCSNRLAAEFAVEDGVTDGDV